MKLLFVGLSLLLGTAAALQTRHALIHATCVFNAGMAGTPEAIADRVASCD